MKGKKGIAVLWFLLILSFTACAGSEPAFSIKDRNTEIGGGLKYDHSMELSYAKEFAVDYYEEGYSLITIANNTRFLIVPQGQETPENLEEDIVVIRRPAENIYLAASAVMDMFISMDALDSIRFSALKPDSWYLEEAKEAMEEGEILYAGKYSSPDYEMILEEDCSLAIENTMIYHTPEVKEKLEKVGIPVLVDYSSYEENPLGRTEWVKLYGVLTGHEKEAQAIFDSEKEEFEAISQTEPTGKTVAFFYITSNGEANVRRPSDYLPKMIEMAGGEYILRNDTEEDSASSTMSMDMESFYAQAKDADFIIYNSTIDGEIASVEELKEKSSLLGNLKAVREGNVYCTTENLYQSTMELGTFIRDICGILHQQESSLTYIYQLE